MYESITFSQAVKVSLKPLPREPQKNTGPYFPLYWLFNRDPYNGL